MNLRRLRADLWRAFNKRRTVRWRLRAWGRVALPGRTSRSGTAGGRPLPGGRPRPGESAPAFDLRVYNPIHWPRHDSALVAALGALGRLPPGVAADRAVRRRDPLRLRRYHHVEDVGAFHADPVARAGELVRLAAAGVVVHVADAGADGGADAGPRLRALLGGELWRLMTAGAAGLDAGARELRSIGMRRAALRTHSTWARAASPPAVSVLLATRRPALLPQALAAVARQRYPRLELVLALHGNDGALPAVRRRVAGLPLPATVVPVPGSASLGAALNAAAAAAGGELLTKMDDDDRYGADHVWDLVLARAYSQAELVGKGAEFVYLAASHRTVCDAVSWRPEVYGSRGLAGGALLISRSDLQRVGGWRDLRRGVDQALIDATLRCGGGVYRTHGAGFALVRHGDRHTWRVGDEWFLAKADRVIPGWAAAAAGISEAAGSDEAAAFGAPDA